MATTYTDQFYYIDPYNPPPVGTVMSASMLNMVDNNDDGDLDRFNNDRIDGLDITQSYPGDSVTIYVPGLGNFTYTGTTFYLSDGSQVFTPTDGQHLKTGELVSTSYTTTQGPLYVSDLGPACFLPGTLIATSTGDRAIETLKPGDLILTRDHGAQPLLWLGRTTYAATGNAAPVVIEAGALGNDTRLVVSQQHRMLITGWQAELYLGTDEALVAAKHLVNGDTIRIEEGGEVDYLHLLLPRHEIVTAAGVPTESYHPEHAVELADRESLVEIGRLFPKLAAEDGQRWQAARQVVRKFEGSLIAA